LKEIVGVQGGIRQPIKAKEKPEEILTHHHDSTEIARHRVKRPVRLLPAYMFERPKNESLQPTRFYGPPTNCSDLSRLGYTLNGFYTIIPSPVNLSITTNEITKVATVYCSFKQPEGTFNLSLVERRVSHSKLDSNIISNHLARPAIETGIHFHVFRSQNHVKKGHPNPMKLFITFDQINLNVGDHFYDKLGSFSAPKPGIYQFICTMVMASIPKNADPSSFIELELTLTDLVRTPMSSVPIGKSSTKEVGNSMTIAVTVKLKKSDQICLTTQQGGGYEIKWASFTGSLLEALP